MVIDIGIRHDEHIQNDGKENHEQEIEEQERPEIKDDLVNHGNDVAEVHEYFHEVECLEKHQQDCNDEHKLAEEQACANPNLAVHVVISEDNVHEINEIRPRKEIQ